jgi:hypothetical protein
VSHQEGIDAVTVAGLSANTAYHVAVFEYNGSSGGENYLVAGRPTASRTTLTAAPTTSAGTVSFSALGANQMTVNWVNGNGSRRLVLMRDGTIGAEPASGTNYTASATYGNGHSFGDGSFAVFDGVNGPVAVGGLNPATTYYVEIYEYNGTGENASYRLASPGSANQSTLAAEPTLQATLVSFSAIATNAMTVGWTNGNGAARIVVMREGFAVDGNPADGVAYALDDALGGGKVVYNGADDSVALGGLTAGVLYHFRVYEFNGSGDACNYLTSASTDNPDSQRTLLDAPVLNAASSVGSAGFAASWTASPNADGYRLDVSTQADFSTFVQGFSNLNVGLVTTHTVLNTDLSEGVTNYYRVRAYNASGTSANSNVENAYQATAIVLYYFDLMRCGQQVKVLWETASEENSVGFHVLRLNSDSTWTQINESLVYAAGQNGMGASYSILDPGAVPGQSYVYKLVEIETDGDLNAYGPYLRNTEEFAIPTPIVRTAQGVVVTWLSSPAEFYKVLRSSSLLDEFEVIASGLPGDPSGVHAFVDADPPDTAFYKVTIDRVDLD